MDGFINKIKEFNIMNMMEKYIEIICRILGWIILFTCIVHIGGWYWAGIVLGAAMASPTWWWIKDKK